MSAPRTVKGGGTDKKCLINPYGRNTLEALERLRRLRSQADYELATPIRNRDIAQAMNLFETYLDECCRILGV